MAQVEKFTWEILWSDRDFFNSVFKTGLLENLGFEIHLKTDHKVAVGCLLVGVDVFAVLQAGFSKSHFLSFCHGD